MPYIHRDPLPLPCRGRCAELWFQKQRNSILEFFFRGLVCTRRQRLLSTAVRAVKQCGLGLAFSWQGRIWSARRASLHFAASNFSSVVARRATVVATLPGMPVPVHFWIWPLAKYLVLTF